MESMLSLMSLEILREGEKVFSILSLTRFLTYHFILKRFDKMLKERLQRTSSFFWSFAVRPERSCCAFGIHDHAQKIRLFIILWLLLAAGLIKYSFYNFDFRTESSTNNETNQSHVPENWHSLFPRNIWQIYLSPPNVNKGSFEIEPKKLSDTASWLAHNRDYEYTLVGDEGADALVRQYFQGNSTLMRLFKELKNTGMKSDLLRYLILSVKGGVYSDIDTVNLKPIELWVPEKYKPDARVVIGVEFDRLDGSNWGEVHPDMQFCQWTIAATPGHPLFSDMVDWVVTALQVFTNEKNTTFSELHVSSSEVMRLTGPSAWTDVVFRRLQHFQLDIVSLRDLSGLTEPKLVGDILLLPIDGFGMGQSHSNSTNDGSIPEDALVQHKFRGSWRHEER
jgi:alpha 1,6-mannosyltransferase